jgi:hypothetical protein
MSRRLELWPVTANSKIVVPVWAASLGEAELDTLVVHEGRLHSFAIQGLGAGGPGSLGGLLPGIHTPVQNHPPGAGALHIHLHQWDNLDFWDLSSFLGLETLSVNVCYNGSISFAAGVGHRHPRQDKVTGVRISSYL